jgi:KipI family sensor histidine kinase inhibitor
VAAGDATLLVQFADRIDPTINQRAIVLAQAIREAAVPGVLDVVSTYRSVAIHFDPLRTDCDAVVARVEAEAPRANAVEAPITDPVRVPVCYAGECGPDLASVAAFAGISEAEAIRLHTSRTYRVFMLGFLPGFTYMGTVDPRIAMPRLAAPRVQVPAGSVGIAGFQTGIYPRSTPGGWRIVGRTPIQPFEPGRPEPFMFKPGAAVQFYAIAPEEFDRFEPAD